VASQCVRALVADDGRQHVLVTVHQLDDACKETIPRKTAAELYTDKHGRQLVVAC
jgi:hypothetical protein